MTITATIFILCSRPCRQHTAEHTTILMLHNNMTEQENHETLTHTLEIFFVLDFILIWYIKYAYAYIIILDPPGFWI